MRLCSEKRMLPAKAVLAFTLLLSIQLGISGAFGAQHKTYRSNYGPTATENDPSPNSSDVDGEEEDDPEKSKANEADIKDVEDQKKSSRGPIRTFFSFVLLLLRFLLMLIVRIFKVLFGIRIKRNEFSYLYMLPEIKESIKRDTQRVQIYYNRKLIPSLPTVLMTPLTYELAVPEVVSFLTFIGEQLDLSSKHISNVFPDMLPPLRMPITIRSLFFTTAVVSSTDPRASSVFLYLPIYVGLISTRLSEAAINGRQELLHAFLLDFGEEGKQLAEEILKSNQRTKESDMAYKVMRMALLKVMSLKNID